MGLYEVLIHSQCMTYSRQQSARPEFREGQLPCMLSNVLLWISDTTASVPHWEGLSDGNVKK